MIHGTVVDAIEATLRLRISGPGGQHSEIDAIIDTGFTGGLTLRREEVDALGLRPLGFRTAILADGDRSVLRMFEVSANWDGENRTVQVLEVEGSPLLGMSMLRGFRLTIEVVDDGKLKIEALN